MAAIRCEGKSTREINLEIKQLVAGGEKEIVVKNPGARHNLAVATLEAAHITFDGSVGYYCAGMADGPTIEVKGSAGWGLAESMMNGTITVQGHAGNGAAASIRGGTVVIHGDAAARAGVSMKGGLLLIAGSCGYMTGFMGQKGTIVVCGNAGEAFADSMYETVCFVGGQVNDLGNDAVLAEPTGEDVSFLTAVLAEHLPAKFPDPQAASREFKKVVAGRKLWNFDKRDWTIWQEAL